MITIELSESDFDAICEVMEKCVKNLETTRVAKGAQSANLVTSASLLDSQLVYERALRNLKGAKRG